MAYIKLHHVTREGNTFWSRDHRLKVNDTVVIYNHPAWDEVQKGCTGIIHRMKDENEFQVLPYTPDGFKDLHNSMLKVECHT